MKNIIIVLIFTCLFSQVIPPEIFDDLKISEIPIVIPSIDNTQTNIRFSDHSISKEQSLGKISYLKTSCCRCLAVITHR